MLAVVLKAQHEPQWPCFLMGLTLVDVVGPFVTLLLQISAGAIIYIGLTWVFSKEDIKELINLFRKKAL